MSSTEKKHNAPISGAQMDVALTRSVPGGYFDKELAAVNTALLNKVNMPLAIPDVADLNNYTTPGMYYYGNGQAITNEPVFAPAFSLFVENTGAWQRGVKQTFTLYSNGDTYIRTNYIVTSGDWSAWVKLATAADLYHPNLLINSNFAINQRGKTTYTANGYMMDGWQYIGEPGATIVVEADGIRITVPSTTGRGAYIFDQIIERMLVDGEVFTGSINVAEVTGAWVFQLPNKSYEPSPVITTPGVYTATGDQARVNERMRIRLYTTTPGATIKVKWMKLEKGAIATPYIPPDPATELMRCQRYYVFQLPIITSTNSDAVQRGFYFPVPMRTTPSLTILGAGSGLDPKTYPQNCVGTWGTPNLTTVTACPCNRWRCDYVTVAPGSVFPYGTVAFGYEASAEL